MLLILVSPHVLSEPLGAGARPVHPIRIPEDFFAAEWKLVTIMGNTMPPRDPNDDDDAEDEDGDAESDDDFEPAVVREPDE